jgi:Spy/CpxP family protein refolding chaperone
MTAAAFGRDLSGINREELVAKLGSQKEEMMRQLQLTEAQKPQVEVILRKSFERRLAVMQELRQEKTSGQGAARAGSMRTLAGKMQTIQAETEKQMAEVLDPQQLERFRKLRDEQRAQLREKFKK